MKKLASILAVSALMVGFVLGCDSGTKPADESAPIQEIKARSEGNPAFVSLLQNLVKLGNQFLEEANQWVSARLREAEHQATTKEWLIAGAVGLLLFGLIGGAGKFLGPKVKALSLIGAPVAWWMSLLGVIGNKVRWRSIIVAVVVGLVCIGLAIWIVPVWHTLQRLGWLGLVAVYTFLVWEAAAMYYTGSWDKVGDGIKPTPIPAKP